MDEMRFDGRTAVVTGAGRGLGREYARLLAARGAAVLVNDFGCDSEGGGSDSTVAEEVVDEIRSEGGAAWPNNESVASEGGAAAISNAAIEQFGRVDILIHNAGVVNRAAPDEVTADMISTVLGVHFYGALWLVKAAWPHLRQQRYGRIILTGSVAGLYGMPQNPLYGASKGALVSLMKTFALDGHALGIHANVISPLAFTRLADRTMRGPLAEWMERDCLPSKVAPAVAWLCHESCTVSGEILIAGGGRLARVLTAETVGVHQSDPTPESVRDNAELIFSDADAVPVDSVLESTRLAGAPFEDAVGYTVTSFN